MSHLLGFRCCCSAGVHRLLLFLQGVLLGVLRDLFLLLLLLVLGSGLLGCGG